MKLEQIRKLGTLTKAYKTLLPLVQEMKMPGYEETQADKALELVFNSISIAKTSPKCVRGTLDDALNMAVQVAGYRGITLA